MCYCTSRKVNVFCPRFVLIQPLTTTSLPTMLSSAASRIALTRVRRTLCASLFELAAAAASVAVVGAAAASTELLAEHMRAVQRLCLAPGAAARVPQGLLPASTPAAATCTAGATLDLTRACTERLAAEVRPAEAVL
eukprot:12675-Heterococcus_DN1.PRE.6